MDSNQGIIFSPNFNDTTITTTDIVVNNLTVLDTISLPDLEITDAEIVSLSASKITGSHTLPDGVLSTNVVLGDKLNINYNSGYYPTFGATGSGYHYFNFPDAGAAGSSTTHGFINNTSQTLYGEKRFGTGIVVTSPYSIKVDTIIGSGDTNIVYIGLNNEHMFTNTAYTNFNGSNQFVFYDPNVSYMNYTKFNVNITGGATKTINFPTLTNSSDTVCYLNEPQTLTYKTMSGLTNTFSDIPYSGLTGTSNLVTLDGYQTLTNKVLTTPSIDQIVNDGGVLSIPATITDTFVFKNLLATLTNKTISGLSNTITNIQDSSLSSEIVTKTGTQTLTNKTLTAPNIATIGNTGTLTLPSTTDTLVGRATTDILLNKTISGSSGNVFSNIPATAINTGLVSNANFDYLAGQNQYVHSTASPTFAQPQFTSLPICSGLQRNYLTYRARFDMASASVGGGCDTTIGMPQMTHGSTDVLVAENWQTTLTNKSLSDSTTKIVAVGDATKIVQFLNSGMTTAKTLTLACNSTTTQTLNIPNITATDTLVTTTLAQTLTSKTLTSPIISSISNTGTITLPTATCTLVGKDTTDVLTNKKLSDTTTTIVNAADNTKVLSFNSSTNTTGCTLVVQSQQSTTQSLFFPNVTGSDTICSLGLAQTLVSKTMTSPTLNSPAFGGTATGVLTMSNTTASTSTSTGALILSGGIGCSKSIFSDYIAAKGQYNCCMSKTASTGVATAAWRVMTGLSAANAGGFQSNSGSMADNANSRISIPLTGKYLISVHVAMTSGANQCGIDVNNAGVGSASWRNAGQSTPYTNGTWFMSLNAGDYIQLYCYNYTASTNIGDATYNRCYFAAELV